MLYSNNVYVVEFIRNRTSTIVVMYSLYLYILGLSLRNTSKSLELFKDQHRSHVAVWAGFKDLVHTTYINTEEFLHL